MSNSKSSKQPLKTLDELDWKLLEEFNANPRIRINDLAKKVNRHRNTISNKLSRPEENLLKTITRPNYEILNYTTAYIFATAIPNVNNKETGEKIAQLAGVEEINVISGEWDFLIKIRGKSIEQIGSTIIEQLKDYCDKTVTAFSFWSFDGMYPYDLIHEHSIETKSENV